MEISRLLGHLSGAIDATEDDARLGRLGRGFGRTLARGQRSVVDKVLGRLAEVRDRGSLYSRGYRAALVDFAEAYDGEMLQAQTRAGAVRMAQRPQWTAVLRALFLGPETPSTLGEPLGLDASQISRLLARMREVGLVEVWAAPGRADRRTKPHRLTLAGRRALEGLQAAPRPEVQISRRLARVELEDAVFHTPTLPYEDRTRFHLYAAGLQLAVSMLAQENWSDADALYAMLLKRFPLGSTQDERDLIAFHEIREMWPSDTMDGELRLALAEVLFRYQIGEERSRLVEPLLEIGGRLGAKDPHVLLWAICATAVASAVRSARPQLLSLVGARLEGNRNPIALHWRGMAAHLCGDIESAKQLWQRNEACLCQDYAPDDTMSGVSADAVPSPETAAASKLATLHFQIGLASRLNRGIVDFQQTLDGVLGEWLAPRTQSDRPELLFERGLGHRGAEEVARWLWANRLHLARSIRNHLARHDDESSARLEEAATMLKQTIALVRAELKDGDAWSGHPATTSDFEMSLNSLDNTCDWIERTRRRDLAQTYETGRPAAGSDGEAQILKLRSFMVNNQESPLAAALYIAARSDAASA